MFNLSDERKLGLAAIGAGLSQMAAGQPANLMASPAAQMLQQRQQMTALQNSGILGRFSPEQQAILAQMPPAVAQRVIAGEIFRQPAKPKITDDMAEYQYAVERGETTDDFTTWMRKTKEAGATRFNMGEGVKPLGTAGQAIVPDPTAPNGYRVVTLAGSEAERKAVEATADRAREAIEAAEAAEGQEVLTERAGNVVLEDIRRVKEKIEDAPWYSPATGFLGNILKDVGGTQAADVQALTMTIRGNIGFDRLQQMRDASPTGGALGQVSERELATLQSVLGSLEQSQSEEQLLQNLDRLEGIYMDIMRKAAAYPNAAEFGFSTSEPMSDEEMFERYLD